MLEIDDGSLYNLASKLKSGLLTPLDLVEYYFDRIEKNEASIQAWCYLDKSSANKEAEKLTKEINMKHIRSPLHGIPIGVKDNIDVKGMPTRMGSRVSNGRKLAEKDAPIIKKLREMGAIILGKTHMTQYAWLDPGPTRNPHNLEHTPGGSSSGSAAVVAARMVPLSIGSQTAASVCRPAGYCGVAAFKPTYKITNDIYPLSPSFDTIGFFANDMDDLIFWMEAIEPSLSTLNINDQPCSVGIILDPLYQNAAQSIITLQKNFLADFQRMNVKYEIVKPIVPFQEMILSHKKVMAFEAAQHYKELVQKNVAHFSFNFIQLINDGLNISKHEYQETVKELEKIKNEFWIANCHVDMFLTIPTATSAPKGLERTGDPSFTTPWTVLGGPLSVIPGGKDENGLPIALMLASAPGRDKKLIRLSRLAQSFVNNQLHSRQSTSPYTK